MTARRINHSRQHVDCVTCWRRGIVQCQWVQPSGPRPRLAKTTDARLRPEPLPGARRPAQLRLRAIMATVSSPSRHDAWFKRIEKYAADRAAPQPNSCVH